MQKLNTHCCSPSALAILAASGLLINAPSRAFAGDPKAPVATIVETKEAPGRVHALLQLEFSDHYITPRGLNVENSGLVFQPLLLTFWDLYSSDTGFIDNISFTAGVWNSIHTVEQGPKTSHWNEIDPIFGLSFKFADQFKLDAFYTQFKSQTDAYPTSSNLSLKLSLDDSPWMGKWALNPYVEYFQELDEKATVALNPATSQTSWYIAVGINPSFQFKVGDLPIKVEFPTFANFCDDDFYQRFDGSGGGSGFALVSTQIKLSAPMTFIPKGYGSWTFYTGVQYYHLENAGLLDGNQVLASANRDKDLVQFHGGISIFF